MAVMAVETFASAFIAPTANGGGGGGPAIRDSRDDLLPRGRWQEMSRWWRYVSRRCRVVSHGVLPRSVVNACGMSRGDVSRDLSRSGLRRECGLTARHLVRVVVVTDIVHISSDLGNERRLTFVISYNKSCELLEGKLGPSIL